MSFQSISILGCGWLGFPLAKRLKELGYRIKGSTTTPEKLAELADAGISPFLIQCAPDIRGKDISRFFQADVLFLNIPFRRDLADPGEYQRQIEAVMSRVRASSIRHVLFAGSTSVYPENIGEAGEDSVFVPADARAKVLFEIEQTLLKDVQVQATVIRFGGMYGGPRRIGQFLAGRRKLRGGSRPVNLIHLEDCVEIAVQFIQNSVWREIFNAVSDGHPTRRALYTEAARRHPCTGQTGLPPPEFEEEGTGQSLRSYKIVSNEKLKKKLGYRFRYPDPLEFLKC